MINVIKIYAHELLSAKRKIPFGGKFKKKKKILFNTFFLNEQNFILKKEKIKIKLPICLI